LGAWYKSAWGYGNISEVRAEIGNLAVLGELKVKDRLAANGE
jgi:hypothetical protein